MTSSALAPLKVLMPWISQLFVPNKSCASITIALASLTITAPSKPLIIAPLLFRIFDIPKSALFVLKIEIVGSDIQRAHIPILRPICQSPLIIENTAKRIMLSTSMTIPAVLAILSAGSSLQLMSRKLVEKSVLILVFRFGSPDNKPLLIIVASTVLTIVSTVYFSS